MRRMTGFICQFLLLAHAAYAITRPENDFDRRRQTGLGHPGFNEHQTRFGLNSPLQNFNIQPGLVSNPSPPLQQQQQFHQPFPQPQQPYVPQFNNINSNQNIQNNPPLPNNPITFNQGPIIEPSVLQHSFSIDLGPAPLTNQNNFLQPVPPTLAAFSNLPSQQNPQVFNNHNARPINIAQQRPTQPIFLPTIPPNEGHSFNKPNAITIHPAPNLGPQNFHQHNSNGQIPFQSNLGPGPVFPTGQTSQLQNLFELQNENLEKLRELQDRQRIIQKHQEFVQKQQQKQQEKVEKLHEEFLSKQATKTLPTFPTTESYDNVLRNQDKSRPVLPHETDLFRKAVEMFEKQNPTTPTTTTSTTTTTTPAQTSRYTPRPRQKSRNPPQDKNKQKLYNEIKSLLEESETKGFDDNLRAKSVELLQKPDILKQLKVALAENPEDFSGKNFSSREISLNGQKFEIIRTNNPNLIPQGAVTADGTNLADIMAAASGATVPQKKESRVSFEELTKGVLPPGADFELIKQTDNGKLEEVPSLPNSIHNKKKITFVFLEEQDDGTLKVKGVKANGQQTEEGPEVESILTKIKNGEIQLPGTARISNAGFTASTTVATPSTESTESTDFVAESSQQPSSYSNYVSTSSHGATGHSQPSIYTTPATNTYRTSIQSRITQPQTETYTTPTRTVSTTERYTVKSTTPSFSPTPRKSFSQSTRNTFPSSTIPNTTPSYRITPEDIVVIGSSTSSSTAPPREEINTTGGSGLVDILKENGLFATAKYLRQSGLDTILNETGPYTIFAPTDKAFRTLLVQLGGPDRAEEKFRDNPRLLSGLLLHHVIPGAFDIGSLQDEMTGVSLAGTQLRVNQYDMHDVEWNEVRVTTINGARVLEDKKDIHIPQGIAHAVDRVMFPLPVGDVVQTLQADRDRRFTTFINAIHASGFADTLSDKKTYTVFAPTDAAFARLSPTEVARYADKAAARALVARHVMPGTLYSAGMRYYQLRNSMEDAKPLTLQKNSGRIKVNNAQVITHNIPATNGVIHAIDAIL